jgi:hypothetical protein
MAAERGQVADGQQDGVREPRADRDQEERDGDGRGVAQQRAAGQPVSARSGVPSRR